MSRHGFHGAPPPPPEGMVDRLSVELSRVRDDVSKLRETDVYDLPDKQHIIDIVQDLRGILFPGYFCRQALNAESARYYIGELLLSVRNALTHEIMLAICHSCHQRGSSQNPLSDTNSRMGSADLRNPDRSAPACRDSLAYAAGIVDRFLDRLPELRDLLATDVEAAFQGDPAADSYCEIIVSYPGILALTVHRLAHELYQLGVPLIPRIMSEYAHGETGIDIHPGAQIGPYFFIDHGTGVVIGETCVIGAHVKLYQGVTLGALSTSGGQRLKGKRRHPTLKDHVTVYGGATILGGDTVIGEGVTIGGNVFLVESVDDASRVVMKSPELLIRKRSQAHDETVEDLPGSTEQAN